VANLLGYDVSDIVGVRIHFNFDTSQMIVSDTASVEEAEGRVVSGE
jgi:ppGpp synthetase/RelA/SpoT-type nucleotidyltranferase